MSDWMKELERLVDEHDPIPDCDCKRCAITERDRLRAALLAHAAQRDHIRDATEMVQPVGEVPMPDVHDYGYHDSDNGWVETLACDEADVRTYGDAREAAGYARGRAESDKLAHTLAMCRETFKKYADMHAAKGTDEGREKAEANMRIVSICDAALRGEVK